ncbi:MAG TPA: hypothetical protein VNT60_08510, partial [Deinococcales bacterium]|nr:hypothetical protein [Deinococcales bacterium]
TYSTHLPDGRTVWFFSDTFVGRVNPDRSRPRGTPMINNSLIVQDGEKRTVLIGGTPEEPRSFFVPSQPDSWYWVYDSTVENGSLWVFLIRFSKAGSGPFGFKWHDTALAEVSLPDLKVKGIRPVVNAKGISWGAALLEDGDYTYIYGVEDRKDGKWMHLARAKRGAIYGSWDFLGEKGWTRDAAGSRRLLPGIANEFSVTRVKDGYLLVTFDTTQFLGADILAYTSCSPEGPWENRTLLYQTPEAVDEVFTYNAHAHPQFTEDGELLISYNQNHLVVAALTASVDFYRPRFFRVAVPALK